ncbi:MAG: 50S ribosomal protein L5 [Candidatus Kerfeldbacteria bacterium]
MTNIKNYTERYTSIAVPALKNMTGRTNTHAIPRVVKVVVNVGVGKAAHDQKELDVVVRSIERITGQKPVLTKARKSISSFKIREGMPIGVMVTLRGDRMRHFVEKLVHAALPRVRDFRGIAGQSFGKSGVYTLGLKEHIVFPEIASDNVDSIHGVAVTIVTTARTPEEGKLLLTSLGFPFQETTK